MAPEKVTPFTHNVVFALLSTIFFNVGYGFFQETVLPTFILLVGGNTQWSTNRCKSNHMVVPLASFARTEDKRGRPLASRKTPRSEDRELLQAFKTLRPLGHYIDARILHTNLARSVKNKISKRTVTWRLKEYGFTPIGKVNKSDTGHKLAKKRRAFAKCYEHLTSEDWSEELQAVADLE